MEFSPPSPTDSGLFIDVEAVPAGEIFALGVGQGNADCHEVAGHAQVARLVGKLRRWAADAAFVAGHNLIAHDLPVLDAAFPIPEIRGLPAVDTLYLSPLAFPRNPYHRLLKNDRMTVSSKNHPARDCAACRTLLTDALAALGDMLVKPGGRHRLSLIRWLISRAPVPWNGSQGLDLVFSAIGAPALSDAEAPAAWATAVEGLCCPSAARAEWSRSNPAGDYAASLSYVLAWLPVAGSDSVIPGWVRHRFPEVSVIVRRLRGTRAAIPVARGAAKCRTRSDR